MPTHAEAIQESVCDSRQGSGVVNGNAGWDLPETLLTLYLLTCYAGDERRGTEKYTTEDPPLDVGHSEPKI